LDSKSAKENVERQQRYQAFYHRQKRKANMTDYLEQSYTEGLILAKSVIDRGGRCLIVLQDKKRIGCAGSVDIRMIKDYLKFFIEENPDQAIDLLESLEEISAAVSAKIVEEIGYHHYAQPLVGILAEADVYETGGYTDVIWHSKETHRVVCTGAGWLQDKVLYILEPDIDQVLFLQQGTNHLISGGAYLNATTGQWHAVLEDGTLDPEPAQDLERRNA
jgi:hypothetical protein